jgi:exonuclease III
VAEFGVLAWNMNHWQRSPEQREQSWRWLDSRFEAGTDIALLQETVVPFEYRDRAVNDPAVIGPHAQWASAVVTSGITPEAVRTAISAYSKAGCALQQTLPGSVQIASVDVGESAPIFAVSVYGCWDEHRCADTTMHKILSDLTPLLDGVGWKRTVLGGDFNVSTQIEGSQRARDATVFARIAALGLVDLLAENKPPRTALEACWCNDKQTERCRHVHTHKQSKSDRPWNNDYLFASQELAERLDSCEPIADWEWSLSDHRPVVARFGA